MQLIRKGTTGELLLTLSESTTLERPYYLFIFIYPAGDVVRFIKAPVEDQGNINTRERVNEYHVEPELFAGKPAGVWSFRVYEQTDPENLDPLNAGQLVERGLMQLLPEADAVAPVSHNPENLTRTVYNG